MGQYHISLCPDLAEAFMPYDVGCGLKAAEQLFTRPGTCTALVALVSAMAATCRPICPSHPSLGDGPESVSSSRATMPRMMTFPAGMGRPCQRSTPPSATRRTRSLTRASRSSPTSRTRLPPFSKGPARCGSSRPHGAAAIASPSNRWRARSAAAVSPNMSSTPTTAPTISPFASASACGRSTSSARRAPAIGIASGPMKWPRASAE